MMINDQMIRQEHAHCIYKCINFVAALHVAMC